MTGSSTAGEQRAEGGASGPRRPPPRGLRGGVGPLAPYKVHGWAYDPAAPEARLRAELLLDGEPIGETTAELFRPDLQTAGIGDGQYGFAFNTDRKMPIETPERVTVRLSNPATGLEFLLRPRTSVPGTAPPPRPAAEPPRNLAAERPQNRAAEPPQAPAAEPPQNLAAKPPQTRAAPRPPAAPATVTLATLPEGAPQRPVFVLGAARSGTSAMAQALFRNTRYVGHGEGHLLDMAPRLLGTVARHYAERAGERRAGINTMIAAVPPERVVEAIGEALASVTRGLFPGGYWLDKTPGHPMIEAVPALVRIWPEARFIFMRRRAIENIASRGRKFPKEGFASACRRWADSLRAWSEVRGALAGRAIEVDWLLMAREPDRVAPAVATLLDLDADEQRRLRQALQVDLPERTSDRFAEVLDGLPEEMDAEQRRAFEEIALPWMERTGYDGTARYWRAGEEGRALVVV
ncbi:MAG: sulfotransferase [Acetobacteraceae bacterium]|nr:sulfotransferase [Acetobacteraceae bacterium]